MHLLKFKQYIHEARRNPNKNPKLSMYEQLKQYKNKNDIYISITTLEKLGINPQSRFDTPIGIYCYPLKETWKQYNIKNSNDFKEYPWPPAEQKNWIWVIQEKGNVIDFKNYTNLMFTNDVKKLRKIFNGTEMEFNDIINLAESDAKYARNQIASHFWALIMLFSQNYSDQLNLNLRKKSAVNWNVILRYLGYDGFSDKTGMGLIHENEPIQAIFLHRNAYKILNKIKYNTNSFNFSWFDKAKKKNYSFTVNKEGKIVWEKGTYSGTWENGTWKSGTFSGTWENGTWISGTFLNGVWENGVFYGDVFENSIWENGEFWIGHMKNSSWYDGHFEDGTFESGTWIDGSFQGGKFINSEWKDGTFNGGEFKNSIWHGGIWLNGKWIHGKIYSKKFKILLNSNVNPSEFKQYEQNSETLEELKAKVL